MQSDGGLCQHHHQFSETQALYHAANHGSKEYHQTSIGEPAKLKGIANDGDIELRHQTLIQQFVDGRHYLTRYQDEEDDQAIDAPGLERLEHTKRLLLDMNRIFTGRVVQEQSVVNQHGADGCHRTKDSGRLRTNEMGTAELNNDRTGAYKQRNTDVLQYLLVVGQHQNQERRDIKHQRQLQDNKGGHLTEFLWRSRTTGRHLVGQRCSRQSHSTKAHRHRIGNKTDHSREHRLETKTDQDGCRYSHCRAKACHTFEHATQAPRQQEYKQTLVGGHLDKLRLDGLYLLGLTKNVITEDGKDDDEDNGEARLEQALHHRP